MSGLEIPLLIGSLAGTGMQVAGGIMSANAQADAAKRSADLKNLQASELLDRQRINEGIIREKSAQAEAHTQASIYSGGLGYAVLQHAETERNVILSRREAEFKAKMLRENAEADLKLSSDAMAAANLSAFGTILGGASRTIAGFQWKTAPDELFPLNTGNNGTVGFLSPTSFGNAFPGPYAGGYQF